MSLSTRLFTVCVTFLGASVGFGYCQYLVMDGYSDCRFFDCFPIAGNCASEERLMFADILTYGMIVSFFLSIVLTLLIQQRNSEPEFLHITDVGYAAAYQGNSSSAGDLRRARFRRIWLIVTQQTLVFFHKLLSLFIAHPMRYMTRLGIAVLAFGLGVFAASITTINIAKAQSDPSPDLTTTATSTQYCKQFNFHWLELENERYTDKIRHVEVFMDEKAFSESSLRELFEYVSKANPEPAGLTVVAHTDWSQLQNPAPGCPATGCGECNNEPSKYDHLQAIFWRRNGREFFDYSPRINVDNSKFKTVVMTPAKNPASK